MVSEIDVFEYAKLNIVHKEEILRLRTVDLAFWKFSYRIKGKNNKVPGFLFLSCHFYDSVYCL